MSFLALFGLLALGAGAGSTPPAGASKSGENAAASEGAASAEAEALAKYYDPPLAPGDTVHISLQEDKDVTFDGEISAAGLVFLPYLGKFMIAGLTEVQAEKALEKALTRKLYERAHVTVAVIKRAPGTVYVYGAVRNPGQIPLPEFGRKNILQAIAEAGGVTNWAKVDKAYILRLKPGSNTRVKIPVDLNKVFQSLEAGSNIVLENGDMVFIPSSTGLDSGLTSQKFEVLVTGQVNAPGVVTFERGEERTFLRAIFKAGGFTRFAKKGSVQLIRYKPDGKRVVIKIDAARMVEEGYLDQDVHLQPGDMIIVGQRRINF